MQKFEWPIKGADPDRKFVVCLETTLTDRDFRFWNADELYYSSTHDVLKGLGRDPS